MSLKSTFERYLDELFAVRDLSQHSIRSYRNRFQTFLDFLDDPDIDLGSALAYKGIVAYFTWLRERDYAPATRYAKRQVIIAFCTWAYEHNLISEKFHFRLKHPPTPRVVYLTPEETEQLERATVGGTSGCAILHLRDRAAFALLRETEIPLCTLSELLIDDYDAEAGNLRIGPNAVLLADDLCEYLNDYLQTRDVGNVTLFTSRNGGPWHPCAMRKAIQRHREAVDLPPLEKSRRTHPRHWSPDESAIFVQTPVHPYENSIEQAQLVTGLGLHCGLRRAEMTRVKTRDVDLHNRRLYVVGKGGKNREVCLNSHMMSLLRPVILSRLPSQPLLVACDGSGLSVKRINSIVNALAERAGITYKNITPHTLRHTFATRLNEQGVNIKVIQILLGHSRLEETGRYVHLSEDRMRNAVELLARG